MGEGDSANTSRANSYSILITYRKNMWDNERIKLPIITRNIVQYMETYDQYLVESAKEILSLQGQ